MHRLIPCAVLLVFASCGGGSSGSGGSAGTGTAGAGATAGSGTGGAGIATGGAGTGGAGTGGAGSGGAASGCEALGRSRGPTQECCPAFGIDACGALLFCAAFDGRTTPTCYPERSRTDGQECGEDRHCTSGACNATARKCKSAFGTACTAAVGCAPAPDGRMAACDTTGTDPRCRETSRDVGGLCDSDAGCASGHCRELRCVQGPGGACSRDAECLGGYCAPGPSGMTCAAGTIGSPCRVPADCTDGQCVLGMCIRPGVGTACAFPADCAPAAPYCVGNVCTTGLAGSACNVSAECAASAPHCVSRQCRVELGRLGEMCSSAADCMPGLACNGLPPLLALCDGPRNLRDSCAQAGDCAQYTFPPALVCDPATMTCLLPTGKECAIPADCQGQQCVAMGRRCSFDRMRACSSDSQCVRMDGSTGSCTPYQLCQ